MKAFNFIYSEKTRTISRTYGGSTYTLAVYEIVNGSPVYICTAKACTRGHKGEESEAFGELLKTRPELKKLIIKRAKALQKTNPSSYEAKSILNDVDNSGGYYSRYAFECIKFNLRQV